MFNTFTVVLYINTLHIIETEVLTMICFVNHHSLWAVLKVKLILCAGHSVLSVKAVIFTSYGRAASRPDRTPRGSSVSSTADVPFGQSTRYTKAHMSGVDGRSHRTSIFGGTELGTIGLRGGPGQAVCFKRKEDVHSKGAVIYVHVGGY